MLETDRCRTRSSLVQATGVTEVELTQVECLAVGLVDENGPVEDAHPDPIPVFVVEGWDGSVGVSNSSWISTPVPGTGLPAEDCVMSMAIAHHDERGRRIEIWSHRPRERSELKQWASTNTMLAWLRNGPGRELGARKFNRLAEELQAEIVEWRKPWAEASVLVDDQPVGFDLMTFDDTHWTAVGYLDDVHITIASVGVPIAGLVLRRTPVGDIPKGAG